MAKSADAFRTISEVAEWLDTPTHVLRFWESKFTQIKPVKRAGGRRYYRPADMELLSGIKKLLHEDGITIRGVQKILREQGVKHVSALNTRDIEGYEPEGAPPKTSPAPRPTAVPERSANGNDKGDEKVVPLRRAPASDEAAESENPNTPASAQEAPPSRPVEVAPAPPAPRIPLPPEGEDNSSDAIQNIFSNLEDDIQPSLFGDFPSEPPNPSAPSPVAEANYTSDAPKDNSPAARASITLPPASPGFLSSGAELAEKLRRADPALLAERAGQLRHPLARLRDLRDRIARDARVSR